MKHIRNYKTPVTRTCFGSDVPSSGRYSDKAV